MIGSLTNDDHCPVCGGLGKIVLPLRYHLRIEDMETTPNRRSSPPRQTYQCPECKGQKPDFFRDPRLVFCEQIVTSFDPLVKLPEDYVFRSLTEKLAKHLLENEFVRREKTEINPDTPDGKTYKYGIYLRVVAP